MKLDGSAVQYFLAQEFGDVEGMRISRSALFDYPMLYDSSVDMGGHVVLVPESEQPCESPRTGKALFVCTDEQSAQAARNTGSSAIWVQGNITFHQLYNYMLAIFVRNERLDARLHAYVDTYAGFQPLLDACAQTMGCSCALVDEQYRSVYQALGAQMKTPSAAPDAELLEAEVIDLFMASQRYRRMRASRHVFAIPGSSDLFMKNVFFEDRLIGTLVMRHTGTVLSARYTHFLLNYLSPFVEEMYARIGSFDLPSSGSSRVRAALHSVLEGNAAESVALSTALAEDGHDRNANYVVLRIERSFTHESDAELDYLARRFELSLPHAYCFIAGDNLFMLADVGAKGTDQRRTFLQNLPITARDNLAKVGVSRVFTNLSHLTAACEQAGIALAQGSTANPTYWYYRFDDYAFAWILARVAEDTPPEHICHPAIATLQEYDRLHGSALLETLTIFMRCRYNATEAASKLFVARSTLLNRLDRIVELTQIDLADPQDRLYLALSLELTM